MKSSILAVALCAVPLFVEGSLGNNGHSKSLLSFRRHDSHKRHAALTPSQKLTMVKKRRSLYARKTPGNGDSTEEPDNIAEGTYTKKQGCAIWHSVGEGEVCLGLIDKSSKDFDLAKFIQFNPSVGKDCQELRVGLSYCVDTVATGTASAAKSGPSPAIKAQEASKPQQASQQLAAEPAAAPEADADVDAEEDCEEEDDDDAQYDDEDDCEEEDDSESYSQDTAQPVQAEAAQSNDQSNNGGDQSNNGQQDQDQAAAQPAPSPKQAAKQQPEQKQEDQPAPSSSTSTWSAPEATSTWSPPAEETSTWSPPAETTSTWSPEPEPSTTSTWSAPAEETKQPEPAPEPQQPDNSGGFEYNAQPATYYYQNGNAGSCGDYNNDNAMIVAIKSNIMGSDLCGKSVKLRNSNTGKVVMAKVADTCPTCTGSTGIDLSEGLFKALEPNANLGTGMFNVDYTIM